MDVHGRPKSLACFALSMVLALAFGLSYEEAEARKLRHSEGLLSAEQHRQRDGDEGKAHAPARHAQKLQRAASRFGSTMSVSFAGFGVRRKRR